MYMEIQSNGTELKAKDQLRIFTSSTSCRTESDKPVYAGEITDVEEYENEGMKGVLFTARVNDYGITQPFYMPGNGVSAFRIDERRNNSGMPPEFMSKTPKDFQFDIYGEDTTPQKNLCNGYIHGFRCGIRGTGLYIYSKTPGSGKTFLACCIANEILKRDELSEKEVGKRVREILQNPEEIENYFN